VNGWRFVHASVIGSSHVKAGLPCQDVHACRVIADVSGAPVLTAVAADGAGSARYAEVGARLACDWFMAAAGDHFAHGGRVTDLTHGRVGDWIVRWQESIKKRAEAEDGRPRDFACTILAAVVGEDAAAFFQVGDGAIVVADQRTPGDYCWVFWPEKGEYENVTAFATEPDALDHLQHCLVDGAIDEVAIFTDGLQRLALHMQSQTVHLPFFRPMFAPLRHGQAGYMEELSVALVQFLGSEAVNSRTDDDKTLILASRLSPATVDNGPRANPVD
jgi:hypothetical protein